MYYTILGLLLTGFGVISLGIGIFIDIGLLAHPGTTAATGIDMMILGVTIATLGYVMYFHDLHQR